MESGCCLVCDKHGSELLRVSGMFSTGSHSTLENEWMNEYSFESHGRLFKFLYFIKYLSLHTCNFFETNAIFSLFKCKTFSLLRFKKELPYSSAPSKNWRRSKAHVGVKTNTQFHKNQLHSSQNDSKLTILIFYFPEMTAFNRELK